MAKIKSNERGKAGELLAEAYLREKGMSILERNFRYQRSEVDIIATNGEELIIVEVKIRQNNLFGFPEEAIDRKKESLLKVAGYAYKEIHVLDLPVRFDIIAISIDEKEIKYYSDAF
jgi:putative endonuclease